MEKGKGAGCEEGDGVLLYYKYAAVPNLTALADFYDSSCRSLGLLGRVRIVPDGVNVTIGGKMSSLEKHIAAVRSENLFDGTDTSSHLATTLLMELVTFSTAPLLNSPAISNAGRHLSAAEFHSVLESSGNTLDSQASTQHKKLLLLDARNVYETRIGRFQTPNVETLDPGIRQYSDLLAWIDGHSEQLHGKHVLMYCTGGIRCEMASAYILSKG